MSFDDLVPLENLTDGTPITYGVVKPGTVDEAGVKFIRGGDVVAGKINIQALRTITKKLSKQYKRTLLRGGELIISLVGNPGEVAVVPKELAGANIARQVGLIRLNNEKVNSYFVQYYLMSPLGRAQLTANSLGSVQSVINLKELKTIKIPLIDLGLQNKIVNILKSIDDKIELNRRMNQNLEKMAQAIFKSWFIDFEPVKAKTEAKANGQDPERAAMCAISGKTDDELYLLPPAQLAQLSATATLFPGELTDSELGLIPIGWKVGSIGDVATAKGGYAYKSNIFTDVGHPVVKIKNIVGDGTVDLANCQCINNKQAQDTSRFMLTDGDLLMAMTGATVGKIGLVVSSGRTAYLNQRVAKFESREFGTGISWFLFCAFQRETIFEQVVGTAQGSAQPNISSTGIELTRIVVPLKNCLNEFISKVEPLFSKWIGNQNEIKSLASLRDTLLPKLLSGEIELAANPVSS